MIQFVVTFAKQFALDFIRNLHKNRLPFKLSDKKKTNKTYEFIWNEKNNPINFESSSLSLASCEIVKGHKKYQN